MPEAMNNPAVELLDQSVAAVSAAVEPAASVNTSLTCSEKALEVAERKWALVKSKASAMLRLPDGFLPKTYAGNPGSCAVACEMAERMNVPALFVMQNLYVIQGNPTWSGKSCKALIDSSGQFAGRTRYRMEGEEGTDSWGCRLIGVDKLTGEKVEGPKVTV